MDGRKSRNIRIAISRGINIWNFHFLPLCYFLLHSISLSLSFVESTPFQSFYVVFKAMISKSCGIFWAICDHEATAFFNAFNSHLHHCHGHSAHPRTPDDNFLPLLCPVVIDRLLLIDTYCAHLIPLLMIRFTSYMFSLSGRILINFHCLRDRFLSSCARPCSRHCCLS